MDGSGADAAIGGIGARAPDRPGGQTRRAATGIAFLATGNAAQACCLVWAAAGAAMANMAGKLSKLINMARMSKTPFEIMPLVAAALN